MRARERIRGEAGFSLPEIILTIAIVGIAFAAILGGMATSIVVSDVHRKQATADALARSAAEAVKDQAVAYVSCAGPNAYADALPAAPSGYSVSITAVAYWDGTSSNPMTFSGTCPSPDRGAQRITVVARSTDGRASETLEFVKRSGT
jgi:prepilin-type N-terminal cleavage/methylation domain-containing protein